MTAAYGRSWDRLFEPGAYQNKDDNPAEKAPTGWTRTFPHVVGSKSGKPDAEFYGHWMRSPFSDEYLGKMAAATVDARSLGKGPQVDFLGVSFSAQRKVRPGQEALREKANYLFVIDQFEELFSEELRAAFASLR